MEIVGFYKETNFLPSQYKVDSVVKEKEINFFPSQYKKDYFGTGAGCGIYQFKDKDGNITLRYIAPMCFGTIPDYYNHKHKHHTIETSLWCRDAERFDDALLYWNFLFTDKRSPFRSLQQYVTIVKDYKDRPVYLSTTGLTEVDAHAMNMFIASRAAYHFPTRLKVFGDLVRGGVDPRVAFMTMFFIDYANNNYVLSKARGSNSTYQPVDNTSVSYDAFFGGIPKALRNISQRSYEHAFHGVESFPQLSNKASQYTGKFKNLYEYMVKSKNHYIVAVTLEEMIKKLNDTFNPILEKKYNSV